MSASLRRIVRYSPRIPEDALTCSGPLGFLLILGCLISPRHANQAEPNVAYCKSARLQRREATYMIQPGDTGNAISARLGIDFNDLQISNPDTNWYNLQIGQLLYIPLEGDGNTSATYITISAGDTGNSIAELLDIDFATLSALNPGINWYDLQVGQLLHIPDSAATNNSDLDSADDTSDTDDAGDASDVGDFDGESDDSDDSDDCADSDNSDESDDSDDTDMDSTDDTDLDSWIVSATDTEESIAEEVDIDVATLATLNPGVDWANLQVGQVLNIPGLNSTDDTNPDSTIQSTITTTSTRLYARTPGPAPVPCSYIVAAGDTGNVISTRLGISFSALSSVNPNVNWYSLQTGQVLNLPNGFSINTGSVTTTIGDGTPPSTVPVSYGFYSTSVITMSTTTMTSSTFIGSNQVTSSPVAAATGAVPTATTVKSGSSATYTVVAGDTGGAIATKLGITFESLAAANPTVTWVNLQIGQILILPSGAPQTTVTAGTAQVTGTRAVASINNKDGTATPLNQYTPYTGTGSIPPWPPASSWISFDSMWAGVSSVIGTNCAGGVTSNSAAETQAIYNAIFAVAQASLMDHRMILAVIMQESNGCVRVPTTYSPAPDNIKNPGIMQSFMGSGTCNQAGVQQNPCPSSTIQQMVVDGVMGPTGFGLVQALNQATGTDAQAFYQAARIYNSGSVPTNGDLGGPGSTRCYASDIANRLTGWTTAQKTCTLDG